MPRPPRTEPRYLIEIRSTQAESDRWHCLAARLGYPTLTSLIRTAVVEKAEREFDRLEGDYQHVEG